MFFMISKNACATSIVLSIFTYCALASSQDCCTQHGDVCGDECCDGTPLSSECGTFKYIELPQRASPTAQIQEEGVSLKPPPKWLYVWNDPKSGTPYFSSIFPPWYRNIHYPKDSPRSRVLVYDEYNRLIDDTTQQKSFSEIFKIRQQATSNLQQQKFYEQSQKYQAEMQKKQKRFKKLLKKWIKDKKVDDEMKKLLEEFVVAGKVTMAMTKKQVQKIWGEPQDTITRMVGDKFQTTLIYNKGRGVVLTGERVTSLKGVK
ncbi:hypothetical protein [Candidatus Parabeggiatoa sp. HSG14]|uniref:hypothetical protein n=1 Tax=Candidatus Parabeggiatoa sp. HSG14 TaxID=3055593 RepID=UPI0025A6E6BC|nr:hypothetical protein [Thiotrichales bacterium HSG14]